MFARLKVFLQTRVLISRAKSFLNFVRFSNEARFIERYFILFRIIHVSIRIYQTIV